MPAAPAVSQPSAPCSRPAWGAAVAFAIACTLASPQAIAEGPPVQPGLAGWWDASQLASVSIETPAGDAASPTPAPRRVTRWADLSGQERHLTQSIAAAQPQLIEHPGFAAVRFDGQQTFLEHNGSKADWEAATIFIVAAPFANPGMFSAFIALSAPQGSDFRSGLNLDLGPGPTEVLSVMNIEGVGAAGARNMLTDQFPFGTVQRFCVASRPGSDGIELFANGALQGRRDRDANTRLKAGKIVLGARYYLAFGPPAEKGFLRGDIAEVLIYNRSLSEDERTSVETWLATKYAAAAPIPIPPLHREGKPLVRVEQVPEVQVFVPGFRVRRLPVALSNINNVLYRPDGKLVALAYDGKVYLLHDTDGDGLEDTADLFWANDGPDPLRAPVGMDLLRPDDPRGFGVVAAAKGKVSLLLDADRDGRAEQEVVLASAVKFADDAERLALRNAGKWIESGHGVDALGVAIEPNTGDVYFGLGTANFTNPYLLENGEPHYTLQSEHGTILRIPASGGDREIVATGIRFPVGVRFHPRGDLFCTDQEGATWLANGNPFDELLHVERGRHYGFPPRHPRFLPNVIDEPSVFDYRPQHQSTCGLNFNCPVNNGPVFGPEHWRDDALVTGYSRGKLYRTQLVQAPHGYIARNHLLACLASLPADACISPRGELVVAVHSGGPDWGSGPGGAGTLYQISYAQPELPQPLAIWPQSEREVRVAFDRPVDPALLTGVREAAMIEAGAALAAGDRFESLRPGYAVVQGQLNSRRDEIPIYSVQLTPDHRTLILATGPHRENVPHALTLPNLGRVSAPPDAASLELPQVAESDLQYDLHGALAEWTPTAGTPSEVWLPHFNLDAALQFIGDSAEHADLRSSLQQAGRLTLRTQLMMSDMLRPVVQPGSRIDYEWPAEVTTIRLQCNHPFEVLVDDAAFKSQSISDSEHAVDATVRNVSAVNVALTLLKTAGPVDLRVNWRTAEDERLREFPLNRWLLPWAPREKSAATPFNPADLPELAGADWARGRKVFFSEQAACSGCHQLQGQGGRIGPDLSNLPHRDFHSVWRDIERPSFAINPDYLSQTVALKSGQVLTGTIRTEGDQLFLGDAQGKVTAFSRDDVDEMVAGKLSVMPEKLIDKVGQQGMQDLMLFLLSGPPHLSDYGARPAPPPRPRSEVLAVLADSEPPANPLRPLHVVLVTGRKDHGPGEHDYPAWGVMWRRLMGLADAVACSVADDWPNRQQLEQGDVFVFYQQGQWTAERAHDMDAVLQRGAGLVYIHYAVDGGQDAPGFAQRIGLAWQGGRSAFRHGELELGFDSPWNHPISRNFTTLHLHDESYWQLVGDRERVQVLATGLEGGAPQPLFWTLQPSNGRVFVSIPGHFSWTFDDPLFRLLLLRGTAWAAGESVDRFNDLIWPGARIEESTAH